MPVKITYSQDENDVIFPTIEKESGKIKVKFGNGISVWMIADKDSVDVSTTGQKNEDGIAECFHRKLK